MKYQPIYQLEDMSIKGAEALIRWEDPVLGIISPGEFIPIAEKNGLIEKLDYWVIQEVFKQINEWKAQGFPLVTISINISSETFEDDAFEERLCTQASKHSINTELIELELTERIILNDINASIDKFRRLRKKGFKIAIDDFGVGYSSLSYLVKLPIDHLKIDRSFINDLKSGKESKVIVSTLVNMAKELDIQVIAEGIETQEELDYLLSINCLNGQGFFLDMPLAIIEINNLLIDIN
jgi:EAL domain-containing protein (putative c-di-GMP-specific phosphodiesterase class I)